MEDIIIFEDSYAGYCSIEDLAVDKMFVCDPTYYYYDKIIGNKISSYDKIDIIKVSDTHMKGTIDDKLNKYIRELSINKDSLRESLILLYSFLKTKVNKNNIYFLGVGKCGHICKKIVSTWSSIGIRVYNKSVEDLLHGEFAVFKEGDIVFFISNSGNTEELIRCAKHFGQFSVVKVGLTFQEKSELKKYMDIYLPIVRNGIKEACHIDSAPTITSMIFMILLDSLGTLIAEYIISLTKGQFKLYHPSGTLGALKPVNTVVISACGKGSRLMPLTTNIPKFLVNIDNFNILTHTIMYWKDYTEHFTIVVQEKYNKITSFYLDKLNVRYSICNLEIQDQENAYTLYNALKNTGISDKLIITWCDIFPSSPLTSDAFKGTTIFTHGNQSRYMCTENGLSKKEGGNVIGIYYFHRYKSMMYDNEKQDICDVIPKYYPEFRPYEVPIIQDVGDMDKLVTYQLSLANTYKTRYFNRVSPISSTHIKKEAISEEGIALIKREMKYYSVIEEFNLPFPRVHSINNESFIMERCSGTLAKLLDPSMFIKPLLISLQSIHSSMSRSVSRRQFENDLIIEFKSKIIDRISRVRPLIEHFGNITHVNGVKLCLDISGIVDKLFQQILEHSTDTNYVILHGDPNFSNIFIDSSGIKFIDPRGYYGSSFLFGYRYYDYSKVLYALSGYDIFNDAVNFHLDITDGNITLDTPIEKLETYKTYFTAEGIDWDICKSMCIFHWLGLTDYISNDIHKAVGAYYTGLFLYSIYNSSEITL
jgi:D-arabinose 5-phosphate isomerase GutQ